MMTESSGYCPVLGLCMQAAIKTNREFMRFKMLIEIQVENIKCGGCAASIQKNLQADDRVSSVDVDIEQGIVKIEASDNARQDFSAALLKMGYPESGTAEGIAAARAKAKSFVSCAIGKVDNLVSK